MLACLSLCGEILCLVHMENLEISVAISSSKFLLLINCLCYMLQAALVLVNAAVKLVTHLASVPSTAAQFRTVLLDMPVEARQQLQV